jgi:hypothetical protein
MIVTAVKIEPPKPETRVQITLDMTLAEAVELYCEMGKTPLGTPLASQVRRAIRTQEIDI